MATALREWLRAELGKGISISWGAQSMLTLKGIVVGKNSSRALGNCWIRILSRPVKAPEKLRMSPSFA
jgi:hypothetical protein